MQTILEHRTAVCERFVDDAAREEERSLRSWVDAECESSGPSLSRDGTLTDRDLLDKLATMQQVCEWRFCS